MKDYLCTSDTNLWTSVDMDTTMWFPTHAASHRVGYTNDKSTMLFTVAQSHQRICRLTCITKWRENIMKGIISSCHVWLCDTTVCFRLTWSYERLSNMCCKLTSVAAVSATDYMWPCIHVMQLRLTWLCDEEADIVTEYRCVSIEKVTGELHHNRKFGQFFQQLTSLQNKWVGWKIIHKKMLT